MARKKTEPNDFDDNFIDDPKPYSKDDDEFFDGILDEDRFPEDGIE